jgi:hypothetical protein
MWLTMVPSTRLSEVAGTTQRAISSAVSHRQPPGQACAPRSYKTRKESPAPIQEEIYWRQRSRINWLQHGDMNTRFFHHTTKDRRRRNKI